MNVSEIVDQLGIIKAKMASMKNDEEALRAKLIAAGVEVAEGELFRATVSHSERATLDMAAVRAKLSRQFIAANTNVTPIVTVKVVSRVGDLFK